MTNAASGAPEDPIELFAEFVRRTEAGEPLTLDRFCNDHPDAADAVRSLAFGFEQAKQGLLFGDDDAAANAEPVDQNLDPKIVEFVRTLRTKTDRADRYRILDELGRGGMGVVYRAYDSELARHVAMKVIALRGSHATTPTSTDLRSVVRFVEEAKITGRLAHPGIVAIHDVGAFPDGRLFYTMRLVQGTSLRDIFGKVRSGSGDWTLLRAVGTLLSACEAVRYAHSRDVIHRDLKPSNIMIGEFGEVYVMDWGVARVLDRAIPSAGFDSVARPPDFAARDEEAGSSSILTLAGEVLGTPAYMAPEQASGDTASIGPRADVYSLGAILYELLAGEAPYSKKGQARSTFDVLTALREGPPDPISHSNRDVPVELTAICERAMERDLGRRYDSAGDLASDLRAFLEDRVVKAHASGFWVRIRKWVRRNRALSSAIAAATLILLVASVGGWVLASREQRLNSELAARNEVAVTIQALEEFAAIENMRDIPDHVGPPNDWWIRTATAIVSGSSDSESGLIELPGLARLSSHVDAIGKLATHRSDPDAHARNEELDFKIARAKWLRRMLRLEPFEEGEVVRASISEEVSKYSPKEKNDRAWYFADPRNPQPGHEVEALVLAEEALPGIEDPKSRVACLDTICWTLFHVGRFDDAIVAQEKFLIEHQRLGEQRDNRFNTPDVRWAIENWKASDPLAELRRLEKEIATIERDRAPHHERQFEGREDRLEYQLGFATMKRVEELRSRLDRMRESTSTSVATGRWAEAIEDLARDPRFTGVSIVPQVGLLPIGKDPTTGLWEFAHLASGTPPTRSVDGKYQVTDDTCLVFVLLPTGKTSIPDEIGSANFHEVELDPFFVSKYEMTCAQWRRLEDEWPPYVTDLVGTLPNYRATWKTSVKLLEKTGTWLRLPTDAQWSYAACSDRTIPRWWCGTTFDDLRTHENLDLDDKSNPGRIMPVGSMSPNPFGLHDVLGNVAEITSDSSRDARRPRRGDGARIGVDYGTRLLLGGSWSSGRDSLVKTRFSGGVQKDENAGAGFRPVRPLLR